MKELRLSRAVDRLEDASVLDPIVNVVQSAVNAVIKPQGLRDLLHGVPIGHPLHPLEVQVPLGAWLSAGVLDLLPGTEKAAKALVGFGAVSALPAAISGYTDWSDLHEQQKRVGVVHSAGNILATGLYALSFIQRSRGRNTSGKLLGFLGLATVGLSGFLGGHLSFRQASGANHTEDVPHRFPVGWQPLGALADLPVGELTARMVAEQPLLVLRRGDELNVLSNVCSHLSGPLNEGELDADGCVTCPWHGSVFTLATGEVVHGPATSPQPCFQTRVVEGQVEVMLPGAG